MGVENPFLPHHCKAQIGQCTESLLEIIWYECEDEFLQFITGILMHMFLVEFGNVGK